MSTLPVYGVPYIEPEVLYWVENGEVDRAISLREPSLSSSMEPVTLSPPFGLRSTIAGMLPCDRAILICAAICFVTNIALWRIA